MANIVELREMNDAKVEELLDDARETLFKLRFRSASAQLEDYTQIKTARREIAQFETVLNMRRKAAAAAADEPAIAALLDGKDWTASVHFDYEESAYQVQFSDEDGADLASALVDLNKKKVNGRRARKEKPQPRQVISFEVAG